MISCKQITNTITILNNKYDASVASDFEQSLYAKLALLEYCGWLEDIMDEIILDSIKGKIKTQPYENLLKEKVNSIRNFTYKDFQAGLIYSLGIIKVEKIFGELQGEIAQLTSFVDFKKERDNYAHKHSQLNANYDAPSKLLVNINKVYPIFEKIYKLAIE